MVIRNSNVRKKKLSTSLSSSNLLLIWTPCKLSCNRTVNRMLLFQTITIAVTTGIYRVWRTCEPSLTHLMRSKSTTAPI